MLFYQIGRCIKFMKTNLTLQNTMKLISMNSFFHLLFIFVFSFLFFHFCFFIFVFSFLFFVFSFSFYCVLGEYGVECRMEPLGYSLARWVGGGWDAIERADKVRGIGREVWTPFK